jgi:hypothetical protein
MHEPSPTPLVFTATLDPASLAYFDARRRALFPPERNHLAAHLTLFHALPCPRLDGIARLCAELAAAHAAIPFELTEVVSLGRGAAYRIRCPELMGLRARIAAAFAGELTAQDAGKRELHVTVQNKVAPAVARATVERLRAEFTPFAGEITGLALHEYAGGPWRPLASFAFAASREPARPRPMLER